MTAFYCSIYNEWDSVLQRLMKGISILDQTTITERETEIDLAELMHYVLRKWRSLLACCLIGAVLGAGVAFFAGSNVEIDMKNVDEKRVDTYAEYQKLYDKQQEYQAASLLMQIDPAQAYVGKIEYYVTADMQTEMIGMLYTNILNQSSFWERIAEAAEAENGIQYVDDLVSITYTIRDYEGLQISTDADLEQIPRTLIIRGEARGRDAEMCERILAVVRDEFEEIDRYCKANFAVYQRETISAEDSVRCIYDNDIVNRQKAAAAVQNEYLTKLTSMEKEMTDDEKNYYSVKYPVAEAIEEDEGGKVIKRAIIFAALLFFAGAAVHCVRFLLNGTVKQPGELRSQFGLHVFAHISDPDVKAKGIDGYLRRRRKTWPANSPEYLLNALQVLNKKPLLLCGDTEDPETMKLMQWLHERDDQLQLCGWLNVNEHAQRLARESAAVVLVVRLWHTAQQHVERELEIARKLDLPLTGAVVIE